MSGAQAQGLYSLVSRNGSPWALEYTDREGTRHQVDTGLVGQAPSVYLEDGGPRGWFAAVWQPGRSRGVLPLPGFPGELLEASTSIDAWGGMRPDNCHRCGHRSLLEETPAAPPGPRLAPRRSVAPDLIVPASLHPAARPDLTRDERIAALALTFPVLNRAECRGLDPWDSERFASNLAQGWVGGTATRQAVLFVLSVWTGPRNGDVWGYGCTFDAHQALQTWDSGQRGAFVAWAQRPWWS